MSLALWPNSLNRILVGNIWQSAGQWKTNTESEVWVGKGVSLPGADVSAMRDAPEDYFGAKVISSFSIGCPLYPQLPLSLALSPRIYKEIKYGTTETTTFTSGVSLTSDLPIIPQWGTQIWRLLGLKIVFEPEINLYPTIQATLFRSTVVILETSSQHFDRGWHWNRTIEPGLLPSCLNHLYGCSGGSSLTWFIVQHPGLWCLQLGSIQN